MRLDVCQSHFTFFSLPVLVAVAHLESATVSLKEAFRAVFSLRATYNFSDFLLEVLSIPSYFTGRRTFFCTACVRPALRRIRRATVPIVPSASLEYVHRASAPGETTNGFDV